jgi:hypothetical protein
MVVFVDPGWEMLSMDTIILPSKIATSRTFPGTLMVLTWRSVELVKSLQGKVNIAGIPSQATRRYDYRKLDKALSI